MLTGGAQGWSRAVLAALVAGTLGVAGCQGDGRDDGLTPQQQAAVQQEADFTDLDPAQVFQDLEQAIGQREEVAQVGVSMTPGPRLEEGLMVAVRLGMKGGEPVPDELAEWVVNEVLEELTGLPAHNVSVHDGHRPGHPAYVGGIGRLGGVD